MTVHWQHRGAAPVAHLQDYDAITAAAVIYLRMWCSGALTQAELVDAFTGALGTGRGRKAVGAFKDLCELCTRHGRRPFRHHQPDCKCVGADEASFGHFIATAAEGDRDDAMLIAILLVRPDVAPMLTSLATQFGLALKQMQLTAAKEFSKMPPQKPMFH